jgi:hypothetical protein
MAIVTVEEAMIMNGWDTADTDLYDQVTSMLPIAEALAEKYCDTSFEKVEDNTIFYSGRNNKFLVLGKYFTVLTAVNLIRRNQDGTETTTAYPLAFVRKFPPDSDIPGTFRAIKIVSTSPYLFEEGEQNISVQGDYGFDTASAPKPLKIAIAHIVKHLFDLRDYNDTVTKEYGANRSYDANKDVSDIPIHVKKILDHYKLNNTWQ